jgi:hypothetical protein
MSWDPWDIYPPSVQTPSLTTMHCKTRSELIAPVSIIGMCIMPRAKFLQGMLINVVFVCLAAACALLVMYTAVKARQHTTPKAATAKKPPSSSGGSLSQVPYNSSASVVAATWMFFFIYVINVARSKLPQLQFGAIIFSIIIIVACSNACLIPTVPVAKSVARSLIIAELFAMSITTAVSLLVVPVSCRTIVKKIIAGNLGAIRGALKAHRAYLHSMEDHDVMDDLLTVDGPLRPEAKAAQASVTALAGIHGQLQTNLPFAKQEIGFDKFGPDELKELNRLLRDIMLPIAGFGSMAEILKQIALTFDWTKERVANLSDEEKLNREKSIADWNLNMQLVHGPTDTVIQAMDEAIEHIMLTLQLKTLPKPGKTAVETEDIEAGVVSSAPGQPGFAAYLEKKVTDFYKGKHLTLIEWGKVRGIEFPPDFFDHPSDVTLPISNELSSEGQVRRQRNQRQLYLLLYVSSSIIETGFKANNHPA